MGRKKRTQVRNRQNVKRRKRRSKLKVAGKDPKDYFLGGTYCPKSR